MMRAPLSFLLDLDDVRPSYRWRLVAATNESAQAVSQGTLVLIVLVVIAAIRTHLMVFVGLAVVAAVIVLGRLWDRRRFMQAWGAAGERMAGTPKHWMRRHAVGALGTAALWGGLDVCVLLLTGDVQLQFLVLMVQAGWIAGACARLAACPAAVVGQLMFSLVPSVTCLLLVPEGLIKVAIPVGLLHIFALLGISRSLGDLLRQHIRSEQRFELMNTQLAEANSKLTRLSLIDGLTGIANRRGFDAALEAEWSRASRDAGPLALLIVDVDFFKLFNDTYGHLAGDDCLCQVAVQVAGCVLRPTDLAARFGGEEFVALLAGTDEEGALHVAEQMRTAIKAAALPHAASPFGHVSVSIGVASLVPAAPDDRHALIRLADAALYEAKRGGRNRVLSAAAMVGITVLDTAEPARPMVVAERCG